MPLFSKSDLEQAQSIVYADMLPTPQISWPQINDLAGTEVWVKHENHTPIGAFKARGALTFIDWLKKSYPNTQGIVTATRGNHGQAQARAATRNGLKSVIYVPEGNAEEKNQAMISFGADLRIEGKDFDVSRLAAAKTSQDENLFMVPPFHRDIALGVGTYALELFTAQPDLDTVYVPIGCGSGICSLITVRDLMGLKTKIVGVVSEHANAAKLSFDAGKMTDTQSANTFADGMAVRSIIPESFDIYKDGAERFVQVSEQEIADAIRAYFKLTHNVAEGAGAAPLAALLQEKDKMAGKKVGVILCGGNIDTAKFATVLQGGIPKP